MREIVLDTETTGLSPDAGHRIIEIGAVELVHGIPTGKTYWQYIHPERDVPDESIQIHGITLEFLTDKPVFGLIAEELIDFLGRDKLVIHNAGFDWKFLNHELTRHGHAPLPKHQIFDTLDLARRKFPGSPSSLDALCKRFGIDIGHRELHGALKDAQLLADVYIELMGSRQPSLMEFTIQTSASASDDAAHDLKRGPRPLRQFAVPENELTAHKNFIDGIKEAIWRRA